MVYGSSVDLHHGIYTCVFFLFLFKPNQVRPTQAKMPYWLAEQFAHAWDAGRFKEGLVDGEPNDEDDWIRFECSNIDVYVRFFNNKLTLTTSVATYFLSIEVGAIGDVIRFIYALDITLETIEYKYGDAVFYRDTYQIQAPPTDLKITWEPTILPDVPEEAFDCNFTKQIPPEEGGEWEEDRFPPAVFPEVYFFTKHDVIHLPK